MTDQQPKKTETPLDQARLDARFDEVEQLLDEEAGDQLSEVQSLTWALMDDQISSEDFQRLEELLLCDEEARSCYVQCVQLHADLHLFFNEPKPSTTPHQVPSGPRGVLPLDAAPSPVDPTSGLKMP